MASKSEAQASDTYMYAYPEDWLTALGDEASIAEARRLRFIERDEDIAVIDPTTGRVRATFTAADLDDPKVDIGAKLAEQLRLSAHAIDVLMEVT